MRIEFIEISNFRKLLSVRVELTDSTTLFVGANNSGKTSAMVAMRHFLAESVQFSTFDFTLSNWHKINAIGTKWEGDAEEGNAKTPTMTEWQDIVPSMDVWLKVADNEIHYVAKLLPTLQWQGGSLGVRLRFEPKNPEVLYKDYIAAVSAAKKTIDAAKAAEPKADISANLWPKDMISFLERQLRGQFTIRGYVLDPAKRVVPVNGIATPQPLPPDAEPIEGAPLEGLIKINEINAQRGFGDTGGNSTEVAGTTYRSNHGLSQQLRAYYDRHLDPLEMPDPSDLEAIQAIESAQVAFDGRLKLGFGAALNELETIGYPGVTDPKLVISTKIRPTDGLDHNAAVQYEVDALKGTKSLPSLRLPEEYNGLGYQNLISMIFRLMGFRDAWMRVGKANRGRVSDVEAALPPLHLVLVEEPEAHLHAQVQQVFIRKAYDVLRFHSDLGDNQLLTTQLVVSTHSSHVAHEVDFSCLRYFRRLPAAKEGEVPVTSVINLSEVFGDADDTQRFVKRYLLATHCDLFFADAAILVEGTAERMLIPHFIRKQNNILNQSYITILEIGGSHAHRLEPLIKHLGLLTLIVTDLDPGSAIDGPAVPPKRSSDQVTNNHTLQKWVPKLQGIDDLLNLPEDQKVLQYDSLFAVRVAYQCPASVVINGGKGEEALSSTFEDALVLENLDFFSKLEGKGLIKKFREAIKTKNDATSLGEELFNSLRDGRKAEFALELLYRHQESNGLKVPAYLESGFTWLETTLRKKLNEIIPQHHDPVEPPEENSHD